MSISAKERREIPDSKMGVPGKDKYPLRTPREIKSANMFINSGKDITEEEKKVLADKILDRAEEEGMDTSKLHAANKVAGVAEQVPPMSDGTSLGNAPPRMMAPYYDEQDMLFSQLDKMDSRRHVLTFEDATRIVAEIHDQVEKDSKPPTGNQNCQLCVWCAEAQCRGIKALPRPIYSPRDPALEIVGETIVLHPVRQKIASQRDVIEAARSNVDSRWYVHVNWAGSEGGHEFLVVNINDYAYIMDPQAGILEEIDETDSPKVKYFMHANYANSYIVRLDNRGFNSTLLNLVNNPNKVLPWDPKLDIPYMKAHGMLSDEDYQAAMDMGDLPIQEAACTASLLTVKNQLMNLLGSDFEFIGGSLIPKFTMKSRMKPDVAIEVNIVGPNVEVTPVYKGIPDMLHKRRGIALMQASHVVADFARELVNNYKPKPTQESFMDEYKHQYTMRKAKDSDLDFVYQSELETVGENKDDPKVQRYIKQDAKDSLGHTKIIVVDGKDVGVYQAYETNQYGLREGKRDWWYLAHIYIKPEYRNLGIGSDVIKNDIEHHDKILLQVMKSNKRAKKLYESLGFVVDMENDHGGLVMRLDKSKPVQEGAIQDIKNGVNPYSDKMVFHVTSEKHADGQVWKPRVPDYLDPYNPEETGFEDNTTPRICFSTSIEGCLNGITVNLPRQNPDQFDKLYVYIPEKPWKEYQHKTNKELVKGKLVYDANVTREVWITEPVRMKLYGVIKVDQVSNVKRKSVVPTSKGEKGDRNYFTYKWHWVVKPKVLEKGTKYDYSPENVIADLCIDLKKFKYGLIKDGRLQTGNVSEEDYRKYWVYHSGQEVDEAGGGNCWDMVEYEAGYLDAFGVPYKKYFMNFTKTDGKTTVNTHTICVVPHNGKFIYIEQAFKRVVDEWGHDRQKTFDSLKEIFQYVADVSAEYDNQDLNYGVWDYTDAKIDYGTPADDFCKWIMSKCRMIYDGEAKKPEVKAEMDVFITLGGAMFYVSEYHNALFDDPDAYAEAVLECGLDISDNESVIMEAAYGPYDEYLKKHHYDPKTNTIEDPNNPGRRINAGRVGSNKERNRMNKFLRENGYDPKTETILTGIDDRSNPGQKKRVKFGINSAIGNPGAQMSIPLAYGRVDNYMSPDDEGDRDKGIAMSKRIMQQKPGASNYVLKHEEGHLAYDDAFGKETNGQWNANPSHHSPKQYRDDITDARQHIRNQVKKNPALKDNTHDMLPTEYQADKYGEDHNPYGRGYGGATLKKMMAKAKTFDPENFNIQREAFLEGFGKGEAGFKAFTDNMREQYDSMLSMMNSGLITKSTPGYGAYKKSAAAMKREIDAGFPASRKIFFSMTQPDRTKAAAEARQRDRAMIDAGVDSRDAFMKKYETRAKAAQAETAAKQRQLAKEQLKQQIASGQLSGDQAAKAERKIQRIEAFEARKQQPSQSPQTQQKPAQSISVGAQDATKPTVKKEGYRVSRFGNIFQEEDEKLSETENITIGDLDLGGDDDSDDEGPGLPGYIEGRLSDDDLEAYNSDDDDFKIPEEGDFESFKVSDEKLDEARGPIEPQPDESLDAANVDLGSFGKDTSDVQNEYDPKEVTILMKLMASEADAMNEYMDGAKETNIDVLRRLYADIANEERFHMEQLLYAKCELTGEKYVPKDPDVKSEYEELLKMGMDEETAMQTAVDKCHIRGSITIEDDIDDVDEISKDMETMETAIMMFNALYDSTAMILESGNASKEDVERAMTVFTEACITQEAVYNATPADSEKSALSKANKHGPIQLLRDTIRFLIRTIMAIIRKFVEATKRISNRSREIRRFIKNNGLGAIFSEKASFYFVNLKFPQAAYVDTHLDTLLGLAADTLQACAYNLNVQLNMQVNVQRDPKLNINNNMQRGAELLQGVQLVKSAFVIPKDNAEQERIAVALFGLSEHYDVDGKTYNTLNTLKLKCDAWSRFMQYTEGFLNELDKLQQNTGSVYYINRKKYDQAEKCIEAVVKTCKAWVSAIQSDINTIIKLDQKAMIAATEEYEKQSKAVNPHQQRLSENYERNYRTAESSGQKVSKFSRFGR